MRSFLVAACVLFFCAAAVWPNWGSGGCAPAQGPVGPYFAPLRPPIITADHWVWKKYADTPDWYHLYRNDSLTGCWHIGKRTYQPWNQLWQDYGAACQPPVDPPGGAQAPAAQKKKADPPPAKEPVEDPFAAKKERKFESWQTGGVQADKISGAAERFSISGKGVQEKKFFEALVSGSLEDDSGKLWLVILSKNKSKRDKLADEFKTAKGIDDFRARVKVFCADPDQPIMLDRDTRQRRFYCKTDPTIYLLEPDGKELCRVDGDRPPDVIWGGLRKVDPKYDPAKTPGLPNSDPFKSIIDKLPENWWMYAAGGLLLFLFLRKKGDQ